MRNILKLTPYQASILADRPDCCIEQALRDECVVGTDGVPLTEEEEQCIRQAVARLPELLGETLEPRKITYRPRPIDVDLLTVVERAALLDCWEGSTIDRMVYEWIDDPLAVSRLRRSMVALHGKLQAVGFNPSPVWF
jgi:hypothetical protein